MPTRNFRFLFLLFALVAAGAHAQNVRWQLAEGYFPKGQNANLVLIFENCLPAGDIELPPIANLQLGTPQQGSQTSQTIINGRATSQVFTYWGYPALPTSDGPIEIPSFTIETDKGTMNVTGGRFPVREATVGDTNIPISDVAQSSLVLDDGEVWAGEVIPVSYTLDVSARFRASIGGEPEWDSSPLVVEEWLEPSRLTRGVGGDARNVLVYASRGYINSPGAYVIPSAQQLVNISIPNSGFMLSLRAEQFSITSDSPQITVKPLPPYAPSAFNGAVGSFQLSSKVVPEAAAVGEPVTWTLQLEGEGNWPDIPGLPARQVSNSFRVVQPDARREMAEGKLFEGTIAEDVVLIPTQPGEFTFGPVEWTYFDPTAGEYKTLSAPATTLQVSPAAAPPSPTGQGSPLPQPSAQDSAPVINATPAPDSPSAIPLEILPGSGTSWAPLNRQNIWIAAGVTIALFPLFWLGLSLARARRLDPGKPARLARRRLTTTLKQIEQSAGSDKLTPLTAWQRDSAVLWQAHHAAPSPHMFRDNAWQQLWREADRFLYAEDAELPSDWVQRAQSALAAKRAPRFPILSVLAPRNLFPLIIATLLLALPTDGSAQGSSAYQQGDFAAAETAWREAVVANPSDWIAHHNLALALAQQSHWDEAAAHASVAFAQNPRHPSARWHLNYTLERGGYTPPVFSRFLTPNWPEKISRFASAGEWQLLFLAGVLIAVISLSLILLHAYGARIPAWRTLSWTGGFVGVLLMASAMFGLQVWSTAADADAAMTWQAGELRSIPTDLNGDQQIAPLAAGSLGRIEKSFLGWRQLSFPNGQTGWVRKEVLVPLWDRAP